MAGKWLRFKSSPSDHPPDQILSLKCLYLLISRQFSLILIFNLIFGLNRTIFGPKIVKCSAYVFYPTSEALQNSHCKCQMHFLNRKLFIKVDRTKSNLLSRPQPWLPWSKMQALIQISFSLICLLSSFFSFESPTVQKLMWASPAAFFLFLPLFLQKNVVKHVRATVGHKSGPINLPWVLSSLRPLSQCDTLLKSSSIALLIRLHIVYTLYFYNNEPSKNKHFLVLLSSLARNSQEPKLKRIFEILWVLFEKISVF